MLCQICNTNQSKYKCPKCEAKYCSIPCYKSHKLTHDEMTSANPSNLTAKPQPQTQTAPIPNPSQQDMSGLSDKHKLYDKILADPQMAHYLASPALQKYLSLLIKYSNSLSSDTTYLLNLKLMDFRQEGLEYSPIVEEFIQRVMYLLERG